MIQAVDRKALFRAIGSIANELKAALDELKTALRLVTKRVDRLENQVAGHASAECVSRLEDRIAKLERDGTA